MAKRAKWCILALAQLHLLDFRGVGVKGLLFHFILSKVQLQVRNRLRVPAYFVVFFSKIVKLVNYTSALEKKLTRRHFPRGRRFSHSLLPVV